MGKPHEHGFGLVGEVMRGHQRVGAVGGHRLGDQPIARMARRFLQARCGLSALPPQTARGKAEPLRFGHDERDLVRRFGPQAMIDGVDDETPVRCGRPGMVGSEEEKREAVGTAGNGECEALEIGKGRKQRRGVESSRAGSGRALRLALFVIEALDERRRESGVAFLSRVK